jgi:hypothetical protein
MNSVNEALNEVFSNPYSKTILTMFLVLYGGLAAPKLPKVIVDLFDNDVFRVIILAAVVYMGNRDPKLAIMIAIGFVISMNTLKNYKMFENFTLLDSSNPIIQKTPENCSMCENVEKFTDINDVPETKDVIPKKECNMCGKVEKFTNKDEINEKEQVTQVEKFGSTCQHNSTKTDEKVFPYEKFDVGTFPHALEENSPYFGPKNVDCLKEESCMSHESHHH